MIFLNAEQTIDAVLYSNLCTGSVREEQLIMQFGVSVEAGRGHALSEEKMPWLQEHPKVHSHPFICTLLKIPWMCAFCQGLFCMLVIMLPCSEGSARTVQSIFQLNGQNYLAETFCFKKRKNLLNVTAKQDLWLDSGLHLKTKRATVWIASCPWSGK